LVLWTRSQPVESCRRQTARCPQSASGVDATLTLNSVGSTTNVLVDTTALTITSAATASGTYGAALTPYNITASKTVASYSATGLPGGVTVNTGTGAISGTPTAAGSFSVTLGATDLAGNAGSKTLTLTVAQASQTVSFAAIGSVTVGSPVALSASASSGLPVTFSVVSGSAAVSGSTLTVNDSGSVVVRATQAGNSNYNAASADQTVSGAAKLAQTITFAALPDRRVGDVLGEANCIRSLGDVALNSSDHAAARQHYEAALILFGQVSDVRGEANCLWSLGNAALWESDYAEAQRRYDSALPLFRRIGDVLGEASCILRLGDLALARSENDAARRTYEQALSLYELIEDPYTVGYTHQRLARLADDPAVRARHIQAAREAWLSIDRPDLIKQLEDEFGAPAEPAAAEVRVCRGRPRGAPRPGARRSRR